MKKDNQTFPESAASTADLSLSPSKIKIDPHFNHALSRSSSAATSPLLVSREAYRAASMAVQSATASLDSSRKEVSAAFLAINHALSAVKHVKSSSSQLLSADKAINARMGSAQHKLSLAQDRYNAYAERTEAASLALTDSRLLASSLTIQVSLAATATQSANAALSSADSAVESASQASFVASSAALTRSSATTEAAGPSSSANLVIDNQAHYPNTFNQQGSEAVLLPLDKGYQPDAPSMAGYIASYVNKLRSYNGIAESVAVNPDAMSLAAIRAREANEDFLKTQDAHLRLSSYESLAKENWGHGAYFAHSDEEFAYQLVMGWFDEMHHTDKFGAISYHHRDTLLLPAMMGQADQIGLGIHVVAKNDYVTTYSIIYAVLAADSSDNLLPKAARLAVGAKNIIQNRQLKALPNIIFTYTTHPAGPDKSIESASQRSADKAAMSLAHEALVSALRDKGSANLAVTSANDALFSLQHELTAAHFAQERAQASLSSLPTGRDELLSASEAVARVHADYLQSAATLSAAGDSLVAAERQLTSAQASLSSAELAYKFASDAASQTISYFRTIAARPDGATDQP